MNNDSKDFELDLEKFADQIDLAVATVTKVASFKVLKGVILKTPVDKSVAIGSWVVGVGSKHPPFIANPGTSPASAIAKGNAVISGVTGYKEVNISSYVHYIGYLEDGHSQLQAPHGMVALTIAEVKADLQRMTR